MRAVVQHLDKLRLGLGGRQRKLLGFARNSPGSGVSHECQRDLDTGRYCRGGLATLAFAIDARRPGSSHDPLAALVASRVEQCLGISN